LIGRISSRKLFHANGRFELTGRLAAEYGLQLVYKKAFNEILSEEQSSRDFGPLLAKMGVLNAEGASNMDGDQWEAASKSTSFRL
jgi:mRNA (guanine-N7-)-methyltransferase